MLWDWLLELDLIVLMIKKLDFFKELSKDHYVIIEYGIESCYNNTLEKINRQHSFEQSVKAIEMTAAKGIHTGAHIIFGLPGESREEMFAEAEILSKLPLNTIKFHQLQIITGTKMAKEFEAEPESFDLFSLEEYIEFIITFIEKLNPEFVIERFAGEVPPRFLAGPGWGRIRNDEILVKIEKKMEELGTWQGKKFND